jgi:hypothetical protein
MPTRRTPDSRQPSPSRPALPEASEKKSAKKTRTAARQSQAVIGATPAPPVSADERRGMIAKAAYLRGEQRGFAPGGEADDWLLAELEIDALLGGASGAAQ